MKRVVVRPRLKVPHGQWTRETVLAFNAANIHDLDLAKVAERRGNTTLGDLARAADLLGLDLHVKLTPLRKAPKPRRARKGRK